MTEANQSSPDVLISGAGPTGLMLALLLASNRSIGMFFPMKGEIARIITLSENKASENEADGHLATAGPLTLGEIRKNFQDAVKHPVTIENPTWLTRYRVHHRSVERM